MIMEIENFRVVVFLVFIFLLLLCIDFFYKKRIKSKREKWIASVEEDILKLLSCGDLIDIVLFNRIHADKDSERGEILLMVDFFTILTSLQARGAVRLFTVQISNRTFRMCHKVT